MSDNNPLNPAGAEVLTGAYSDFYSGPVYSGRLNCNESADSLRDCQLSPPFDDSCAADPSRAVGFRCVRGMCVCVYVIHSSTMLIN